MPREMSEPARQRLMELGASNNGQQLILLQRVVKIQALFRAYRIRKRLEEIRNTLNQGTENGEFDDTIKEDRLFQNEKVKEVYYSKGAFQIPDLTDLGIECVMKGPYLLGSGACYMGEWQADLQCRAGKGR